MRISSRRLVDKLATTRGTSTTPKHVRAPLPVPTQQHSATFPPVLKQSDSKSSLTAGWSTAGGGMTLPPAVHVSQLPQPTGVSTGKWSTRAGIAAWTLSIVTGIYAVVFYDFPGNKEHCFMPVRRWLDYTTSGFFSLSEKDRAILAHREANPRLPYLRVPDELRNDLPDDYFTEEAKARRAEQELVNKQLAS